MNEYLYKLKGMCDKLQDEYEREVFASACRAYQDYCNGERLDKLVTKQTILDNLKTKRLCRPQSTDDRKLRESARNLLKRGYPIMATSKEAGYYIADSCGEIDLPQAENKKRALQILAVDKGYDKVRQMLGGQIEVTL